MDWKPIGEISGAFAAILSLLKVYQEYQIQKHVSSINTDIIYVEIYREPLDKKYKITVLIFYIFAFLSFVPALVLQYPVLYRLYQYRYIKSIEGFEFLKSLVFIVEYLLIIYVSRYYFAIIQLVSKVPTEWSYFLFEKVLISVEVKYELAFFQSLKAIKELGIRIK